MRKYVRWVINWVEVPQIDTEDNPGVFSGGICSHISANVKQCVQKDSTGNSLGSRLLQGEHIPIWIRRRTSSSRRTIGVDSFTLSSSYWGPDSVIMATGKKFDEIIQQLMPGFKPTTSGWPFVSVFPTVVFTGHWYCSCLFSTVCPMVMVSVLCVCYCFLHSNVFATLFSTVVYIVHVLYFPWLLPCPLQVCSLVMVSVPSTCFCLVYTCILVTVFIPLSAVGSVCCWFRSCCFLNVCYSVLYSCIVWLLLLLSVFVPVFCRRNYVHWLLILLYIIIGQYSCLSIHLLLCSSFIGVDFVLCVAIFWFIPVSLWSHFNRHSVVSYVLYVCMVYYFFSFDMLYVLVCI